MLWFSSVVVLHVVEMVDEGSLSVLLASLCCYNSYFCQIGFDKMNSMVETKNRFGFICQSSFKSPKIVLNQ